MDTWGKHSRPKEQGPPVGACLAYVRNKEASVAREGKGGRRGVEMDVRGQMGPELADLCEDFGFCSELDLRYCRVLTE